MNHISPCFGAVYFPTAPFSEDAVREAVAEGICTREELFITSKMWVQDMADYDMAKAAIDALLKKSGLEYLEGDRRGARQERGTGDAPLEMGYVGTAVRHFDPEFVRMCVGRKIHDQGFAD